MGRRQFVMDVLGNVVAFALFFNVFAAAYVGFNSTFPWQFLLMVMPFFGLFVLRKLIKSIKLCVILNILCILTAFFIPSDNSAAIMVFFFAVASVVFSAICLDMGEFKPAFGRSTIIILLITLAYVALDFRVNPQGDIFGVNAVIITSAVIVMAATIIHVQMGNFDYNFSVYRGTGGGRAEKGVFRQNNILAWVFTALAMAVAIVFVVFPEAIIGFARIAVDAFAWLFSGIMTAIAWIVNLFLPDAQLGGGWEEYIHDIEAGERDGYYGTESLLTLLARVLMLFAGGLAVVGVVIGLFLAITFAVRRLIRLLRKRRETVTFGGFEQDTSNLQFDFKDLATFLPRLRMGGKHPLRRAYIRKVNFYMRRGVNVMRHHVPEEIAEMVAKYEDIRELTELYKAVRYGSRD